MEHEKNTTLTWSLSQKFMAALGVEENEEIHITYEKLRNVVDIQELLNEIRVWSQEQFGDHDRTDAMVDQMLDEVGEMWTQFDEETKDKAKEKQCIADVMILLLDVIGMRGFSVQDILLEAKKKMMVNKNCKWEQSEYFNMTGTFNRKKS